MVTAGGAETLPFLASFGVLPASVGFFVLYGKMVRLRQGATVRCISLLLGVPCNEMHEVWPCSTCPWISITAFAVEFVPAIICTPYHLRCTEVAALQCSAAALAVPFGQAWPHCQACIYHVPPSPLLMERLHSPSVGPHR